MLVQIPLSMAMSQRKLQIGPHSPKGQRHRQVQSRKTTTYRYSFKRYQQFSCLLTSQSSILIWDRIRSIHILHQVHVGRSGTCRNMRMTKLCVFESQRYQRLCREIQVPLHGQESVCTKIPHPLVSERTLALYLSW